MKKVYIINLVLVILGGFASVLGESTAPMSRTPGTPAGSYKLSEFDDVNLFSGNLNFNLSLLNAEARGDSGVDLSLTIENQWSISQTGADPNGQLYFEIQNHPVSQIGGAGYLKISSTLRQTSEPCIPDNPYYWVVHRLTLTFVEPNGTEHTLVDPISRGIEQQMCDTYSANYGKFFQSVDGSFATFWSDADIMGFMGNGSSDLGATGYLTLRDGTKARVESGKIIWTKDQNGNITEYTYASNMNFPDYLPRPVKIKDSINREIEIQYDVNEPAPYGLCHKIIFKGANGQERVTRVSLGAITRSPKANTDDALELISLVTTDPNDSPQVSGIIYDWSQQPKAVWLPDGRSYKFEYNVNGRLARVELPTGGYHEYDFYPSVPAAPNSYDYFINRLKEKRVFDENNVLQSKTVFTQAFGSGPSFEGCPSNYPSCGAQTIVTVETFDANNNLVKKSKHYFHGSPIGVQGNYLITHTSPFGPFNGKERMTENLALDGSTVLIRVERKWRSIVPSYCYVDPSNSNPCGQPYPRFPNSMPVVAETKTTLVDANLVSLVSAINPNTQALSYDQFNNQTDVYEYEYGVGQPGSFKRRTHTDFVSDPNYTSYAGSHLRSLPLQKWISSDVSGSNIVSRTQFEYDNYSTDANHAALIPRANVTGFDSANFGANYIRRGNVTAVTNYENAQAQTGAITAYSQYDILGNVVKTIDARGYASTIDYTDRFGSPDGEARTNIAPSQLNGQSSFAFATAKTNSLGWVTYSQFDYHLGEEVDEEDLNGVVDSNFYDDPLDRETKEIKANNIPSQRQQTITIYDDDADRRVEKKSDLFVFGDGLSKSESFYDGLGRTTETRDYEENNNYVAVQIKYDALGRAFQKSNPFRPNEINTNNPIRWTTSKFDGLERLSEVEMPDQSEVSLAYNGNVTTVTDEAGKPKRTIFNALGQLTRVDEPKGTAGLGTVDNPEQPTIYTYDTLGNLIQIQQNGNNTEQCGSANSNCSQTRTFTYDSLNRLKTASNPESGTLLYSYDNNGNLSTKTDARGVITTFTYDALNRVGLRDYSDSTPDITYFYDDPNIALSRDSLTKVHSSVSTTEYTGFDATGNILGSKQTTDGQSYSFSYAYSLSGDLLTQTYPSGKVVRYGYSNDGELAQVSNNQTQKVYANSFSYAPHGQLEKLRLGNGKWETRQFNARLQITQIGLGHSISDAGLWKVNYEYGDWESGSLNSQKNNGSLARQTIVVPTIGQAAGFTASQIYNYDSLDRLKSATETVAGVEKWKQSFLYDRFGNRQFNVANTTLLSVESNVPKVANPEVLPSNNRFKQDQDNDGQADYLYDESGNQTKNAYSRVFTYDGENRQLTATGSSLSVSYVYDGNGRRVKSHNAVTNQTTIFVYDTSGNLAAEYAYNAPVVQNPTISYLTEDALESVRAVTNSFGEIKSRRDFLPFGEELNAGIGNRNTAQKYSSSNDDTRKKFATYQRDAETGLDYAQSRYYSPMQGRFTSPDEFKGGPDELFDFEADASSNPTFYADLEIPQSLNKYQYTYNNPYKYNDPSGHCLPWCLFGRVSPIPRVPVMGPPPTTIGARVPPIVQTAMGRLIQTLEAVGKVAARSDGVLSAKKPPYVQPLSRNIGRNVSTKKAAKDFSTSGRNSTKPTPAKYLKDSKGNVLRDPKTGEKVTNPKRTRWDKNREKAKPENHPNAKKSEYKRKHFHDQRKPENQKNNYRKPGQRTNNHYYFPKRF